jgi:hypothetical protein
VFDYGFALQLCVDRATGVVEIAAPKPVENAPGGTIISEENRSTNSEKLLLLLLLFQAPSATRSGLASRCGGCCARQACNALMKKQLLQVDTIHGSYVFARVGLNVKLFTCFIISYCASQVKVDSTLLRKARLLLPKQEAAAAGAVMRNAVLALGTGKHLEAPPSPPLLLLLLLLLSHLPAAAAAAAASALQTMNQCINALQKVKTHTYTHM